MFIPLWHLTTQTNAPELNLSTLRTGRGRAHLIRTTHVTLSFDCERSKVLHVIGVAVLQAARLPSSFSSLRRLVHFYCLLLLLYSSALQPGGRGAAITHTHTHTLANIHPPTHSRIHAPLESRYSTHTDTKTLHNTLVNDTTAGHGSDRKREFISTGNKALKPMSRMLGHYCQKLHHKYNFSLKNSFRRKT